ncbi:TonB-dependent siderophore receptor [Gloeocapsa sp. PCC 73106]|uniref:TonB-dependent siderophore receptor n=1 Tax=Gloeocapsa sp. PCC 73106 TaxID=102232 RepID=UPI0002D9B450|nr:TonB-dependent siderophore receptor [Gloeocapsa sp. PCC 73106]
MQAPIVWAQANQIIKVIDLRVELTQTGLELIINTVEGALPNFSENRLDNTLVVEFTDAQLELPDGKEYLEFPQPINGIESITVKQEDPSKILVTIVGSTEAPVAELTLTAEGLILGFSESLEEDSPEEDITEITITARLEQLLNTYTPPDTPSIARDGTFILDVPQDIDIVPEQVIRDQKTFTVGQTFRNISGVTTGRVSGNSQALTPVIRGFESSNILRNGLRDGTQRLSSSTTNIERIEVLKGPASILFGSGSLGGTVNLVTKQPLLEPFYGVEFTAGQYNFYRPQIDLTGPLNEKQTVAYRLISSYETSETFIDFEDIERRFFLASSISWQISKKSQVTFETEYANEKTSSLAPELPAAGTVISNPNEDLLGQLDIRTNLGEPSLARSENGVVRVGYRFQHQFNENWSLNNEFLAALLNVPEEDGSVFILPVSLDPDGRTLNRLLATNPTKQDNYTLNTNVIGNFNTGIVAHKVLVGAELAIENESDTIIFNLIDPIDIYEPVYSPDSIRPPLTFQDFETQSRSVGIYFQDQVSLPKNFTIVLGGRVDFSNQDFQDLLREQTIDQNNNVFSPRIGLIYKPIENMSLYFSFSRSFEPVIGQTFEGEVFEPERGTQYELGIKAQLLENKLFANLAFYDLSRTNYIQEDPNNPGFQIQIGEQKSKGVEFDVTGVILPGWNIIATYTYTDATIKEDEIVEFVDNQLPNVPNNAFSVWTTYTIQKGNLEGLGFGFGVFFEGERDGDLQNSFTIPSYARLDAALYYRRENLKLALNLKNITDQRYFQGARNEARVIPGEPFTILGTISLEF